ncbi:MAG: ribosome silencing factor [Candidatus Omnitrophota bacterium]
MDSIRSKGLTSKQLANKIAQLAADKKGQEIVILDMRGLVNFCDYFVLVTGTSDRQVNAISQGINDGLSDLGIDAHLGRTIKGFNSAALPDNTGAWALLDMGDVVAHVFDPIAREFYGLEHLWQDAPSVIYKERKKKKV